MKNYNNLNPTIMKLSANIRKLTLTSHLIFSIGWLGAVAVFIALAITGLTTKDFTIARSMYISLEICTLYIIIPFCIASFLTGIIQAVGTKWGLFKHYWIIIKLFLTFAMTILLFLHLKPISLLSSTAIDSSFTNTGEAIGLIDIIKKAGAALFVLIAIVGISIYKPWGTTKYAMIKEGSFNSEAKSISFSSLRKYILIGLFCSAILFIIIKHLFGGGMHH